MLGDYSSSIVHEVAVIAASFAQVRQGKGKDKDGALGLVLCQAVIVKVIAIMTSGNLITFAFNGIWKSERHQLYVFLLPEGKCRVTQPNNSTALREGYLLSIL